MAPPLLRVSVQDCHNIAICVQTVPILSAAEPQQISAFAGFFRRWTPGSLPDTNNGASAMIRSGRGAYSECRRATISPAVNGWRPV